MDPSDEEDRGSLSVVSSGLLAEDFSGEGDDAGNSGSVESPATVYSEEELSLSGIASKSFASSDYARCLSALESLFVLRPGDPPVAHNRALLEFLSQKRSLSSLKELLEDILSKAGENSDHESLGAVQYNLALCGFFQRQFQAAESHLLKVLELNRSCQHDEAFLKRVTNLLCRVYIANEQGDKLLKTLGEYSEASELQLFRVQSLLLSRNHKGFKKDLKDITGEEGHSALEFLRANSEFLKGNPRKAHKLLSNLSVETGNTELDSFYHNNMGIVHIMQGKPNLAAHYLSEALEKTTKLFQESPPKDSFIPEYLLKNKKMEITYNLGIALLNAGTYTELSFEYFLKTLPMYQKRPSLWLHLAECCIQSYQSLHAVPTYSDAVASTEDSNHRSTTLSSIDPIQHQKIVLNDSGGRPITHPGGSLPVPLDPPSNKNLNLDFGLSCLRNAAILHRLSPRKYPESLLAAILLNSSYVALLLKDFVTALSKANELLDFLQCASEPIKDLSTSKLLGHLYAGLALIYLDRMSTATVHLGPNALQSLDSEPGGGEESEEPSEEKGPYNGLGFSTLNFNLSVAFALRGELDKAKGFLERSMGGPKSVELATKCTMMNLYLHVMKKDRSKCLEIIRDQCDLVKIMPISTAAASYQSKQQQQ